MTLVSEEGDLVTARWEWTFRSRHVAAVGRTHCQGAFYNVILRTLNTPISSTFRSILMFVYIPYQGFSVVLEGMEEAFRVCRVGVGVQPSTDMTGLRQAGSPHCCSPHASLTRHRGMTLLLLRDGESPDSPISLQREDWRGASFQAYHVFPTIMLYEASGLTTNDWW